MAATMSWLNDLKYIYKCHSCGNSMITADDPDKCCGSLMSLERCSDPVMGIISDSLGDVRNPIDGKIYDSKSAYHRKLKETGHHVYEGSGNKEQLNKGDHNVTQELRQAAQQHLTNLPTQKRKKK